MAIWPIVQEFSFNIWMWSAGTRGVQPSFTQLERNLGGDVMASNRFQMSDRTFELLRFLLLFQSLRQAEATRRPPHCALTEVEGLVSFADCPSSSCLSFYFLRRGMTGIDEFLLYPPFKCCQDRRHHRSFRLLTQGREIPD